MRLRKLIRTSALLLVLALMGLAAVTQPFVRPTPSQPPEVDAQRLEKHVRHLSVDLYPRSHDQFRNLNLAAQYIHDEFRASGGAVSVQDVVVEETTYKNIVARFGPTEGPLLVIGAHYDSHGDANAGARDP